MSKDPLWRRLCCTCKSVDDVLYDAPYEHRPRRKGARTRVKSNKTWTRRSLLENEQAGEDEHVPIELMAYQMRAVETPTNIPYTKQGDDDEQIRRRLDASTGYRQRQSVQNVFNDISQPQMHSQTTFPWMDEKFKPPSSRNGTRLGVRSLHLSAQTAKPQLPKHGDLRYSHSDVGFSHAFQPYMKYPNFQDRPRVGQVAVFSNGFHTPQNSSHQTEPSKPFVPSRHGSSSNLADHHRPSLPTSAVPKSPPSMNGHLVLKAPTSDVAVHRLNKSTSTQQMNNAISNQNDSIETSLITEGMSKRNSKVSVLDVFPRVNDCDVLNEQTHDSFSSEFSLKKVPGKYYDESQHKTHSRPGIFSGSKSKYGRLKSHSTKGKGNTKPDMKNKSRADSMYGYVPKAVQHVYASTALEGSQIDDYFRISAKRHHRRTSRDSITEDMNHIELSSESENDEEPVIVTSVTDKRGPETIPEESFESLQHALKGTGHKVAICDNRYENKALEHDIDQVIMNANREKNSKLATELNSFYFLNGNSLNSVAIPGDVKGDTTESPIENNGPDNTKNYTSPESSNARDTVVNGHAKHVNEDADEQVIMIDFPPNYEADKLSGVSSVVSSTVGLLANQNGRKSDIAMASEVKAPSNVSSRSGSSITSGTSTKSILKYTDTLF